MLNPPLSNLFCSGHCYCQGRGSPVKGLTEPLTRNHHTVALVSLPHPVIGRRRLAVSTDHSQKEGTVVTVTEWVGSVWEKNPSQNIYYTDKLTEWTQTKWTYPSLHSPLYRLGGALLTSDLLTSIHVGDRVLEINGTPVRNISLDEVSMHNRTPMQLHLPWQFKDTKLSLRRTWLCHQIQRVIQDTGHPVQLTVEHNPSTSGDPLPPTVAQDASPCTDSCVHDNLKSSQKLPSLEEEPNPEEQTEEPIRLSLSPPQGQGLTGMRSRHIL